MEESLYAIFADDFGLKKSNEMLNRWCGRASCSRLPSFIRLSKTIRTQKRRYPRPIRLGVSNGRVEGLNTGVRSIIARSERVSLRQGYPRHGDASLWTASSEATLGWDELIRIAVKGAETATARMSFIVETLGSSSIPIPLRDTLLQIIRVFSRARGSSPGIGACRDQR
ncbi:MAG: transposase [Ferrimicrobium acidiphilum]